MYLFIYLIASFKKIFKEKEKKPIHAKLGNTIIFGGSFYEGYNRATIIKVLDNGAVIAITEKGDLVGVSPDEVHMWGSCNNRTKTAWEIIKTICL